MNVVSGSPPAMERLADPAKRTAPPKPSDSALSVDRPFPGLRPFAFADRSFFFGRESQIFALYRLIENGRFVAVVGSSGSGKSSLVLAGLCGLLEEETEDPNGPAWVRLDMRPGGAPIKRLAAALSRLPSELANLAGLPANNSEEDAVRLEARIDYRLRQSSFSLESALVEAGGLSGRHLLLIVDQFEELFRFGLAGLGQRRSSVEEAKARDEAIQFVEILLDADRRRLPNVHVLITMRSDFIGDCAYFHGLPEAVSATQYLVPNLTRGQLVDAIREPILKAGATIEPELVERLLNDCDDELDQLPVLQHCLMRLWDQAGAATAKQGGGRRLTRQTYDDVGRMAEALSRHADEVLGQCAGKELAVEQAFRALSEIDREGRATRRALRFDKLLAETGVDEVELRAVLDRFRASSCSFLVPPPSVAAALAADDRVDIGHETLLRRWKTIAGKTEPVDPKTGKPPPGWLAEERSDGQRYHTLVSLLDGETGGERATLTDPERTKAWWESLPRTAAWADRYGGRFDAVKKLIDDGIEAKRRSLEAERRSRRNRWIAAALLAVGVVGAGFLGMSQHEARQREIAAQETLRQEEVDKSSMKSAKTLLEDVLHAYTDKSLDVAGAESLAAISGQFLANVRASIKTSAADLLWAQALNVDADLEATLKNNQKSLALAKQAEDAAALLTELNPNAQESLQALYDAQIRIGNALSGLGGEHKADALKEYNAAIEVATKIDSLSGEDQGEDDVIDAHMKIGDVYKDRDLKQYSEARNEYQSGLAACLAALAKRPDSFILLRDKGKAFFRIAELLRTEKTSGTFDEARAFYRQASEVQQALVTRNAQEALASQKAPDSSLKSNLAATYTNWGLLEKTDGDLKVALEKLQQGVALDEELAESEPGNPLWQGYVTPNYLPIAQILDQLNRPEEALAYYQKYYEATRTIAYRAHGPGRSKAMKDFAEAAKLLGDHSTGLARIEAYRSTIRIYGRMIDDPSVANVAAEQFELLSSFARGFDENNNWPDAQAAHRVAMKIAVFNYVKNPEEKDWRDKAEAAERALVQAQVKADTAPVGSPH
jgi:tetratricopeptide (TPR) repeat protein/energy-coupling factor transporter ATP-binding protein EcfA2